MLSVVIMSTRTEPSPFLWQVWRRSSGFIICYSAASSLQYTFCTRFCLVNDFIYSFYRFCGDFMWLPMTPLGYASDKQSFYKLIISCICFTWFANIIAFNLQLWPSECMWYIYFLSPRMLLTDFMPRKLRWCLHQMWKSNKLVEMSECMIMRWMLIVNRKLTKDWAVTKPPTL